MLKVLRDNLIYGLNATNKVVSTRSTLPSLSCVLLEAQESGDIMLHATDLETALTLRLGGMVDASFRLCVPSKELNSILAPRNEDLIEASFDEANLSVTLKFGRAKPKLRGLDADEFPLMPNKEDFLEDAKLKFEVDTKELLSALERVIFSASDNMAKPTLTTVLFRFNGDLTLLTTDGYRLSLQTIAADGTGSFMIPANGLQKVMKLLSQFKPDNVTVAFDNHNRAMFASDDFSITVLLQDGSYPDISSFEGKLSKKADSHVTITTADLERSLKTALVYNNEMRFGIENGNLLTKVRSQEHGDFQEEIIPIEISHELEFALNLNYLLDILRVSKGETITLSQFGKNTPVYVYTGNDKINYWIIMPLAFGRE